MLKDRYWNKDNGQVNQMTPERTVCVPTDKAVMLSDATSYQLY